MDFLAIDWVGFCGGLWLDANSMFTEIGTRLVSTANIFMLYWKCVPKLRSHDCAYITKITNYNRSTSYFHHKICCKDIFCDIMFWNRNFTIWFILHLLGTNIPIYTFFQTWGNASILTIPRAYYGNMVLQLLMWIIIRKVPRL